MLNIHPAVVHIPIGLLSLYSVLEIIRIKRIQQLPYWFYTKAILLISGLLGGFLSLQTGDMIESQFRSALMEVHSSFAIATLWVYGIPAVAYLLTWYCRSCNIAPQSAGNTLSTRVQYVLATLSQWLTRWPAAVFALAGFCLMSITGALGGALVHGPEIDPFVSFVYHLFF